MNSVAPKSQSATQALRNKVIDLAQGAADSILLQDPETARRNMAQIVGLMQEGLPPGRPRTEPKDEAHAAYLERERARKAKYSVRYKRERFEECEACGAPSGEYVTRQRMDHLNWTMNLDVFWANKRAWTAPKKVVLSLAEGLCHACRKAKAEDLDGVA